MLRDPSTPKQAAERVGFDIVEEAPDSLTVSALTLDGVTYNFTPPYRVACLPFYEEQMGTVHVTIDDERFEGHGKSWHAAFNMLALDIRCTCEQHPVDESRMPECRISWGQG